MYYLTTAKCAGKWKLMKLGMVSSIVQYVVATIILRYLGINSLRYDRRDTS
ncbi:MAG: hypothetical protein K0Q87_486 [Neobacillus sp.]|jgi:hypothetical protein|nr:hypothetical protein [Neobacillus sp.]